MLKLFKTLGEFIIIFYIMKIMYNIYNFAVLGNGIFIPIRLFGGFFILTFAVFSVILAFE